MKILDCEIKGDYLVIEYDDSIPFLPEQDDHEYLGYTKKIEIKLDAAKKLKSILHEL